MEGRLTDDTLTQEQAMEAARKLGNNALYQGRQAAANAEEGRGQVRTMGRAVGDQVRNAVSDAGATAQDLARRAREEAALATDVFYQQGARAGKYLIQNVNGHPLTALLIAGGIGFGMAYLMLRR
jgi:hypothetical protein